jgi:hypothetical protein
MKKMRSAATCVLTVALVFAVAGCGVGRIDLSGRSCPCAKGWVCDVGGVCRVPGPQTTDNLRAAWTTSNSIRWEWNVTPGPWQSYVLVVGPVAQDVAARTGTATLWTKERSRDLGEDRQASVSISSIDKPGLGATVTDGLQPNTEYFAELIAIQEATSVWVTNAARGRTLPEPNREAVIFQDDPLPDRVKVSPEWYRMQSTGGGPVPCQHGRGLCYGGRTPAPDGYFNLKFAEAEFSVGPFSKEVFENSAFLEFALVTSKASKQWMSQQAWISFGKCPPPPGKCIPHYEYEELVIRGDGRYQIVQLPLRALVGKTGPLTYDVLHDLRFQPGDPKSPVLLREFNVGAHWSADTDVRVDEVRVRWSE